MRAKQQLATSNARKVQGTFPFASKLSADTAGDLEPPVSQPQKDICRHKSGGGSPELRCGLRAANRQQKAKTPLRRLRRGVLKNALPTLAPLAKQALCANKKANTEKH